MEATVQTPWDDQQPIHLYLDNLTDGDGYKTHLSVKGHQDSYDLILVLSTLSQGIRSLTANVRM